LVSGDRNDDAASVVCLFDGLRNRMSILEIRLAGQAGETVDGTSFDIEMMRARGCGSQDWVSKSQPAAYLMASATAEAVWGQKTPPAWAQLS
jgi:hypothetical protein